MADRNDWPIGSVATIDDKPFTVMRTADTVPRNEVNVMQHGTGSIRTARLDQLARHEPITKDAIEQIVKDTMARTAAELREVFDVELRGLAQTLETVGAQPNAGQAGFGLRVAAGMVVKYADKAAERG